MPFFNYMKNFNNIMPISIIVVLIAIILFRKCDSKPIISTPPIHDTIYKNEAVQYNIFNKLKLKNDSLLRLKPKYKDRYVTVYDSLYITDTLCKGSLIVLYNEFTRVNTLNDSIIKNDSLAKVSLINIIALKQSHITIDSTFITTVPKMIRKEKRKSFFRGLITGGAIIGGVGVGAKLVP